MANVTLKSIIGIVMIISGYVLKNGMTGARAGLIEFIMSVFLLVFGILLLFFSNSNENSKEPGSETLLGTNRHITITVNDEGGATLISTGLNMHDAVAALEISKLQIISQFTRGGTGPMEIIRRK